MQTGDTGRRRALLDAMARLASGVGLIPEQNWEFPDLAASPFGTDPTIASIGFMNGGPAGSACTLDWSAGSFVRLAADLAAGRSSTAGRDLLALRRARAGHDGADRHEPGRPELPSPVRP